MADTASEETASDETSADVAACAGPVPRGACEQVVQILNRIGDKWSVMVIMALRQRERRFNELKRDIGGISQRMLTLTLRNLERDGLVIRTVTPSIPPRVDYKLTEVGHSLAEPVQALGAWAFAHLETIGEARTRYDAQKEPVSQPRLVKAAGYGGPTRAERLSR